MFWIPLAMAAAGAVAGAANQREQRKQAEVDNKMNALETKYSPWISPQYRNVTQPGSMIGSVLGGAASGGMMGAQMGSMGGGGNAGAQNFVGDANVNSGGGSMWAKPRGFQDDMNRRSFMTA